MGYSSDKCGNAAHINRPSSKWFLARRCAGSSDGRLPSDANGSHFSSENGESRRTFCVWRQADFTAGAPWQRDAGNQMKMAVPSRVAMVSQDLT
jgi:hypothetical protein